MHKGQQHCLQGGKMITKHHHVARFRLIQLIVLSLILVLLSSCQTGEQAQSMVTDPPPAVEITQPTETQPPAPTDLPPKTATAAALIARESGGLRLMTYNILMGGNMINETKEILLRTLETYDPDVLAIQEANGWDAGNFAVTERFANELGYNYVYCKSLGDQPEGAEGTFDTIIMTRFEILESEVNPDVGHCLGRVKLALPNGEPLHVFNVHSPHWTCKDNFPKLVKITQPYMDEHAVLMGDFNVVNPTWYAEKGAMSAMEGCPEILLESDWTWLEGNVLDSDIDQIWVSPSLAQYDFTAMYHRTEFLVHYNDIGAISDHRPKAVDIYLP
jgi:endonuclease/exonuclease/phosphatase family metal-dependent hydrolase